MVKIPELKSQHVWLVVLLVFIYSGVSTIGAPFLMSEATEEAWDFIENIPEGSICVMGGWGVFAFDLESTAAQVACVKQMARRGLRLVCVPTGIESVQLEKYCIDVARVDEKYGGPWEYGVDYAVLPYLSGGNARLIRFLEDVHGTVSLDVLGTPLSELPIFDDFHSYEDIAVWTVPHWSYGTIALYVTGERGVPSISFAQAGAYPRQAVYMNIYPDKVWITNGFLGGAQYERLENCPGLGHSAIDGYAIVSAVYLGFIVLGNAKMLTTIDEEEEEEIKT